MAQVEQTPLPGVGVRYDFTTGEGRRLGVVHHHDGRKEIHVGMADDPQAAAPLASPSPTTRSTPWWRSSAGCG